eukprot:COSAG02_NODE_1536_length_12051_cov_8.897674_8_plen_280_part_00
MTGVKPDDTCAASFEALKAKKESRFIIYTITADGKHITKAAAEAPAGSCQEDWGKFAGLLTGEYASKCCYAVFDFDWEAEDGHSAQKIMFVLWSPEGAKVKDKMMTTGSKDALKKALVGIGQDFQATDASEITYEECLEKAKSAVRPDSGCVRRQTYPRKLPLNHCACVSPLSILRLPGVRCIVCVCVCAVHQRLSFCTREHASGCANVMSWPSNDKLESFTTARGPFATVVRLCVLCKTLGYHGRSADGVDASLRIQRWNLPMPRHVVIVSRIESADI